MSRKVTEFGCRDLAFSPQLDPRLKARYSTFMRKLAVLIMLALRSSVAQAGDSLIQLMQGSWTGEGERVQTVSGHRVRIEAHVVATLQGDRLFSHNEITETEQDGQAKSYARDYWIRPSQDQAGSYDFGVEDKVTSQGRFDGHILEVEQNVGGSPAFVIRSETQFTDSGSLYQETAWYGERELSQTLIRYHR